ncbi:MAG: DUF4266 domain-containing protein [Myxococcales bacterium]|nr:DUF4266 domain-containing protein [Myxococcales bacterium]
MRRSLFVLPLALFAALGAGCSPVHAWQRGTLAHRCMAPDSRPEEAKARTHMLGAREGSSGASGEVGGGCGCK